MVKTNKKSMFVTMLVVLLSAILLIAGLAVSNSKPQIDARVRADGSEAYLDSYSYKNIYNDYAVTNLITTTIGLFAMGVAVVLFTKQKKRYNKA